MEKTSSYIEEFLTPEEFSDVQTFVAHPRLLGALKKVMLFQIYTAGTVEKGKEVVKPMRNFAFSHVRQVNPITGCVVNYTDAEIANNMRASCQAVEIVESGFNELEKLKEIKLWYWIWQFYKKMET